MKATLSELQVVIRLSKLGLDVLQIDNLFRASATLQRLAEQDCNVGLTERQAKRRVDLFQKCQDMFTGKEAVLELKTDPRAGCGLSFFCFGCEWYI